MTTQQKESPAIAYLSCADAYTSFSFGPHTIRFRTPKSLKRYTDVREWDHGYLVVGAEYDGAKTPTEEYIDLEPILRNLYLDPKSLSSVREVHIA